MSSSSSSSKREDKKPVIQKFTPFSSQNRFSPLTPVTKNSQLYSNILQSKLVTPDISPIKTVSPFNKIASQKIQSSANSTSDNKAQEKAPYVLNPNFQKILILEDYQIHKLHQGFHILTNHLFGQGKTFCQNSFKTREYYQAILQESGSVQFNHRSNSNQGNIDFSKAHIIKIISPENWAPNLQAEKPLLSFPSYPRYTYFDYQDAWTNAFLLRNYSHSWFIFFDINFNCEYPRWFINWYRYMGLVPSCLPTEVFNGYKKFKELFVQQISEFEYLLQFTMLFKIPWIMSWTFHYQEAKEISPPWLNRQYRVKWWDKFKNPQANDQAVIKHYQQIYIQKPEVEAKFINSLPSTDAALISRIKAAVNSSPEELQNLLQEIRSSPIASEDSPKSVKNELFQDAQDPFDDPYEN